MNSDTQGPSSTTIAAGGATVVITSTDLEDMKRSLVAALERSEVEDKADLLQRTRGAEAGIDAEGSARIGGWLLDTRGTQLVLSRRLAAGQSSTKGYLATLEQRNGKWVVTDVVTERIRVLR